MGKPSEATVSSGASLPGTIVTVTSDAPDLDGDPLTGLRQVAETDYELGDRIDLILDGGSCPLGVESTIVSMVGTWPELLRPGSITLAEIREVIGPVVRAAAGRIVAAPGQLTRHYATRTPMTVLAAPEDRPVLHDQERAGLLAMSALGHVDERYCAIEVLSPSGDLREAARNLFAALRRLDERGLDRIYAEPCNERGLGLAIMDRLRRCAVPLF